MSSVIANENVVTFLSQVHVPSNIEDSAGKLLGVFTPLTGLDPNRTYSLKEAFEYFKTLTTDPVRLADVDKHIAEMNAREQECAIP